MRKALFVVNRAFLLRATATGDDFVARLFLKGSRKGWPGREQQSEMRVPGALWRSQPEKSSLRRRSNTKPAAEGAESWWNLQVAADFGELGIDLVGKAIEAGDGHNREQGRDQSVFNEVLAGLVIHKVLHHLCHVSSSP